MPKLSAGEIDEGVKRYFPIFEDSGKGCFRWFYYIPQMLKGKRAQLVAEGMLVDRIMS